ncbi:MAG: type II toxin-antitoxin system RelE/ParE family toxin [Alphaproteobacteria bacterium]|nr:type II toxin-antitoxin system RelE/ParE family toxin [Alphaproteobacteria bacterium]
MNVFWLGEAERDYLRIADYQMQESPRQAVRVLDRIDAAAKNLADFPDRFRRGPEPGTRERVVQGLPYILVYRMQDDFVEKLSIFHAAQDRPCGG